jgi:hypothetical protein
MKNKKSIFILLPAVLLIWGVVLFKVFGVLKPSDSNDLERKETVHFVPDKIVAKEKIELNIDYRDPFLGTFEIEKKEKKIVRVQSVIPQEEVVFPVIEYKGSFSGSNNANTVYLLVIDGAREMFKLKETHREIKLLQGDKEKTVVRFKSVKKTIILQQ